MKKFNFKKAGLILTAIIAIFTLTTCETIRGIFSEPVLTFRSVELAGISFSDIKLLAKVNVENPNSISIPFPDIDWEFFVDKNSFIKGQLGGNQQSIKARRSNIVDVLISFTYVDFFNTFASLKGREQANFAIALAAKYDFPVLGELKWNFDHEGVFPVLQMPKISAPSFKLDKLDFTKAELLFSVNVENPNQFELPLPKMAYDYSVNNNSFLKSSVDISKPLAAAAVTPVLIRLSVNYLELFQNFLALRNLNEVQSRLSLNTDFNIPAFAGEGGLNLTNITAALPLLKVPVLTFNGIRAENISLTRLDFKAMLEIENNNNFAMNVKDFNYNLMVNNSRWGDGKVANNTQIPAGRKVQIPIDISFSSLSMVAELTRIITNSSDVNFSCTGNYTLGAALPGLDDFSSPFDFAGLTKLLR